MRKHCAYQLFATIPPILGAIMHKPVVNLAAHNTEKFLRGVAVSVITPCFALFAIMAFGSSWSYKMPALIVICVLAFGGVLLSAALWASRREWVILGILAATLVAAVIVFEVITRLAVALLS